MIPTRLETTINYQLEVLANNKILVPGCEPASSISSRALSAYLAAYGCGNALVDVNVALNEIPGSYLKFGSNFNRGNIRQRWFVLPPVDTDCPCASKPDWYKILRSLADEDLPIEEVYDRCDVIGMGHCPSPDFNSILPPAPDPYVKEGSFPVGGGVLPPVPPWAL